VGGKKLTRSLIIKILSVFLIGFPSFALANYDKQCDISFQSYVSPSIAGCVFSAKKSGDLSFKLSGRNVTPKKCFSAAGMADEQINQFMEMVKGENFVGEKGVLLIKEQSDLISGKITTNSFPNDGMDFPPLKKDFGGTAKATLDTGISIKLKVKKSAELTLAGDFGTMRLSGPCRKHNATSTPTTTSSSKLDKAKSTCTELGFTLGTEKHGECVLKMMDK
jgi:hypothetical protein